jgi:hypothetical protein
MPDVTTSPRVSFTLDEGGKSLRWVHQCESETGHWWLAETGNDRPALLPLHYTDSYRGGTAHWDLVQPEPLTVTPSILCDECGVHGFITNGEWVPA